jgi:hypothetical protein
MVMADSGRFALHARLLLAGLMLIALAPAFAERERAVGGSTSKVSFNRDIRPLLSDRCFTCHGPDAAARKAELRLDTFEEATKARKSGAAIVPGDADSSQAWQRINSADNDDVMPPPESEKHRLSGPERELIRKWIESGAQFEKHWSFIQPVKCETDANVSSVIDALINAKLRERGIIPNTIATREELARRVYLDLTGLPPTIAELDEFLRDDQANAYERLVDKLLTQEPYITRYAERMTEPWLDQARYADTSGIHMDAGRSIWPWRDWVLNAFKSNMPFDRFIVEQLAGDLIPDASTDQKIATGFNRNHVTSDEGGAINEEYLVEYAVDRVNTTSSVLLGLTVGCARCHDHKYDPISMDEFYGLFAYFNSIEEPGIYSQLPDATRAFEPFLEVPTSEQTTLLDRLSSIIAEHDRKLSESDPADHDAMSKFFADAPTASGVNWTIPEVIRAESSEGSTLSILEDRSVLASGANPDVDSYTLTLRSSGVDQRLVMLEVLTDESVPGDRPGRAGNGNAMMTGFSCSIATETNPSNLAPISFQWAWADIEQMNGDYRINSLWHPGTDKGWALNGHTMPGRRTAILLADRPFGTTNGLLTVKLEFRSPYQRHAMARVRIRTSPITQAGLDLLPVTVGTWHVAGPFEGSGQNLYDSPFGPEEVGSFDFNKTFAQNRRWLLDTAIADGAVRALSGGTNVTYLAQRVYAPTPRSINALVGSDDAIRIYVNGIEQFGNNAARAARVDQDRAILNLHTGSNDIIYKVINTGGDGGFASRIEAENSRYTRELVASMLPSDSISVATLSRTKEHWRYAYSPTFRANLDAKNKAQQERAEVVASIPRTMVMKELATPRETFVLTRGQYDHPDKSRPATRSIPKAIGTLPANAPANRLGFAQWIVSADNPLTARVLVNRIWAQFFGNGFVTTGEDFGLQGSFPSHPELLDHLAVTFRESGWDLRALVRAIVVSDTYRRSAKISDQAAAIDPENILLARFPRQRMSAEAIRDAALAASGLIVERFGGPPVKPVQPSGLWEETSMLSSNTRTYVQGNGPDLYRRSLYTYWKRASPPPNMQVFDAPTRESCVTKRITTNTPLQALVLWNDPQFVEAARVLAQSVIAETSSDDARLTAIFRRLTSHTPDSNRMKVLRQLLTDFKSRYESTPEDARKLLAFAGEMSTQASQELASWTMVACAVMSTDSFITKD